jgi:hypothetical protein
MHDKLSRRKNKKGEAFPNRKQRQRQEESAVAENKYYYAVVL